MTGAKPRNLAGYTVIELLVVMLLFAVSIAILSQTYISFVRLSHKTSNASTVQQDLRYFTEYAARLVRNNQIDYTVAPDPAATSTLRVLPASGLATLVRLSAYGDPSCADLATIRCLLLSVDGGATWSPLTSKGVNVDEFKVVVKPSVSPFVLDVGLGDYPNDTQPYAVVYLKLTYMAKNVTERVSGDVQTTISSRVYVR